jgi:ubiquinone/menaquinone biosynthesis C-methylase UbiE
MRQRSARRARSSSAHSPHPSRALTVRPVHLIKMAADALHLPFGDGVFDAVSILFGLRNIVGLDATLAELANVTRPGGRLVR